MPLMYESSAPASQTPLRSVDPFHEFLDDLYRFAQALTLDELSAATLVEETCHRAALEFPPDPMSLDKTQRMFELLAETYREEYAAKVDGKDPSAAIPDPEVQAEVPQFRRRMADQVLERVLPVAITALPDEYRALIVLCDLEGLSCARAAEVMGLDLEAGCRKLDEAHQQLLEIAQDGVTESERRLLQSALTPELLPERVQQILRQELAPMPATLRMSVDDILATGVSSHLEVSTSELPRPVHRELRWGGARVGGALVALGLILVAGLIAYLVSDYAGPSASTDLITLAARGSGEAQVMLETGNPEQAEGFVQVHFDLRLTLPEIDRATLQGVGIENVASDVKMPVVVYRDDETGEPIVLYAYSYALLDRNKKHVSLATDIRSQIEDDDHFDIHDLGTSQVLIFRNRDDIFVVVTRGDPEALQQRIVFPS